MFDVMNLIVLHFGFEVICAELAWRFAEPRLVVKVDAAAAFEGRMSMAPPPKTPSRKPFEADCTSTASGYPPKEIRREKRRRATFLRDTRSSSRKPWE